MDEPSNNCRRLARELFADAERRELFLAAFVRPAPYTPALIWLQPPPEPHPFRIQPAAIWQPHFVDVLQAGQRPGQDPLHEAGAYYCLDVSSVFAASALAVTPPSPTIAIDVCAAPGGKSIFAWRLLAPEFLIANETIKKRTAPLIANLARCQVKPAGVSTLDCRELADHCATSASLVLVDAPCSGQSLLVRGKPAPGCFHPATINLNANRQRRILANSVQLLEAGGYLAYMTCTFARKENEGNCEWLLKQCPWLAPSEVPFLDAYQSHLADVPCYRLWPFQGIGAGAFVALFRAQARSPDAPAARRGLPLVWES